MKFLWFLSLLFGSWSLSLILLNRYYGLGKNLSITALVFVTLALIIRIASTIFNFTTLSRVVGEEYIVYVLITPMLPVIGGLIALISLLSYKLVNYTDSPLSVQDNRIINSKINTIFWWFFSSFSLLLLTDSIVIL